MPRTKQKEIEHQWLVKPVCPDRKQLANTLRVSELVAQLLYNRGVANQQEAQPFLQPSLQNLIDPHQLIGIKPAVKRIRDAIANEEKIVLYGDYDVDGIMSITILWRCLKLAGVEVDFYVPHRLDEGYGLNEDAIRTLAKRGTKLIVTVDCGISAHKSAALAAELGIDLIVTDHHKVEGGLVPAVCVVHPNLEGQDYDNPHLCGAGVAFKLAWAIAQEFSGSKKVSEEFRSFLLCATGLAGLGTIADVVPLVGENRLLARFGLEGLTATDDVAIKALIKAANLEGKQLDSTHIGFRLAPKLNAAGRMGHARLAVELFTKSNAQRAEEIAAYLESQNRQRQKVEKEITAQAIQQVEEYKMTDDSWRGLVLAGPQWHGGVIGIVASRIVDKFNKPTIVISTEGDKAMGSCRSVPGFDICQAIAACSDHLLGYGGHAMAAGLSLDPDNIDLFRNAFNKYAKENLTEQDLVKRVDIDAEITLEQLTLPTVQLIEQLEPFGAGNPRVRLVARNLKCLGQPRRMGSKGTHLNFNAAPADDPSPHLKPGGILRVVAFSKANWEKKLLAANTFDLVFEPVVNRFNGSVTVEMVAEDIEFTS